MKGSNTETDFESIVRSYSGIINKICYYFSDYSNDFKDLRQEALINIWKGLSSFRCASKPSTWIYRVCLNSCVTYQRKNAKNKVNISIENIVEIPEGEKFNIENYNELHRMISNLSQDDKAIILLWLDELSYEEISAIIGLNKNTIGVRINRIKEKLIRMSNR